MKKQIIIVLFIAAALAMALGYKNIIEGASTNRAAVVKTSSSNDVAIGGAFELTNHKGEKVTDKTYSGKLLLVFFGFTNCPDVCPTDLMVMSSTIEGLGEKAKEVVPLFITIDPETDDVEQMASYLKNFNENIEGLTGNKEQLKAVRDVYKVYAQKVEMESLAGNMFSHSSFTYLMDREGNYLSHFPHNTDPQKIISSITKYLY